MAKKTVLHDAGTEQELLPAWLSPQEAATYIGVSPTWFYTGVMKHVLTKKMGRLTRVNRASLDSYMDALPDQGPRGLRPRHAKGGGTGPRVAKVKA